MITINNISIIISIISSAIATITLIYKIGVRGYKKEREYYDKILSPFIINRRKNLDVNAVKFCKPILRYNYDSIPPYIYYLVEENNNVDLKKVLILDYTVYYSNFENSLSYILNSINKIIMYSGFFMAIALIIETTVFSMQMLSYLMSGLEFNYSLFFLYLTTLPLPFIMLKVISFMNNDMYTINRRKIHNLIKHKVKIYNKRHNKFYY